MYVLGLDTATPVTTVALFTPETDETIELADIPTADQRPGHTNKLLLLIHQLFSRAQISWDQIDRIAVGNGPGTFTGLRVGIATARAFAQAHQLQLVCVNTLEALAAGLKDNGVTKLTAIDARRGEIFFAAYRANRVLQPPIVLSPQQATDAIIKLPSPKIAVGDGAVKYRDYFESVGVDLPADSSELHRVNAAEVCRLSLDKQPLQPYAVLPNYLREPDAKPPKKQL